MNPNPSPSPPQTEIILEADVFFVTAVRRSHPYLRYELYYVKPESSKVSVKLVLPISEDADPIYSLMVHKANTNTASKYDPKSVRLCCLCPVKLRLFYTVHNWYITDLLEQPETTQHAAQRALAEQFLLSNL